MRLSAEAMNAALADFQRLQYATQDAAAYEAFLSAKWVQVNEGGALPSFTNIGRAVPAVFGILPSVELGRLAPFRYDWITLEGTGRKTVWNNNSRGGNKKSLTLFANNDIRGGLVANAAALLGALIPALRPSWQSLAVLILRNHDFTALDDWPTAQSELLASLGLAQADLASITTTVPLGPPLLGSVEWDETTISEGLRPPEATVVLAPAETVAAGVVQPPQQVIVDARVERMLRLALSTTSSILLVGPPGTGKGTLLKWALGEIATHPERYSFEAGFDPNPLWRTPDESWSSFELVGGLAPDPEGKLRWSPGALLNAIADERWLILDETNRGDMDKIMGPLLTWLSDQEVEVGRSLAHEGRSVRIGWHNQRASKVLGVHDGEAIQYLAGTDFRLLGTYNPQDAQRVFRFGQALSRRFVVVPVPAIRRGQFSQLLGATYPTLGIDSIDAISGLYAAHLDDDVTALGPAVFLRMAKYVLAGLSVAEDATELVAVPNDEEEDEEPQVSPLLAELLAEAYTMGVGRYLASFDDRNFDALGSRIVTDEAALDAGQWTWIKTQRRVLS